MELTFELVKLTKNYARYQSGINTIYIPLASFKSDDSVPKSFTLTVPLGGNK